jgi:ABC-type lipoprotein export system ATPase subunit
MIPPGASVIELRAVSHGAGAGSSLHEICLAVAAGTLTLLRGENGSGTRELLRLLGLMELPASGSVLVEGTASETWSEEQRAEFRSRRCGLLLPAPFLLPALTVIENVGMAILKKLPGTTPEEATGRVKELLAFVEMSAQQERPAGELGPVEQYRVALARALASEPVLLLAEEVDAAVPADALPAVLGLLRQTANDRGVAVVASVSANFPPTPGARLLECTGGRLRSEVNAPLN